MARKNRGGDEGGGQEWMNTYSDLVTLLMTFFVLLFSMSKVDAEKWEIFIKALANEGANTSQIVINKEEGEGDAPLENEGSGQQIEEGPSDQESTLPTDFDDLYAFLQSYVEENNLGESIEVMKDGDSVVYIRFQNNIFFAPDKADLLPEGREVIGYLGDCLAAVQEQIYVVSINGHTADVGMDDYAVSEWMLSGERACQVADFLDNEKNVDPTKLRPMGYGKSFPVADNSTEEGKQKNRRVDITIVREEGQSGSQIEQQLASLFDPDQFPRTGGATDLFTASQEPGDETLPDDGASVPASQGETIPPPSSSTGEVIPPPASSTGGSTPSPSSSAGEVIPPPASSAGAVIPPPSSAAAPPPSSSGGVQLIDMEGAQGS